MEHHDCTRSCWFVSASSNPKRGDSSGDKGEMMAELQNQADRSAIFVNRQKQTQKRLKEMQKQLQRIKNVCLNVTESGDSCHQAADAFWDYWKENGETHKHGYYESTWGAINAALRTVGVVIYEWPPEAFKEDVARKERGQLHRNGMASSFAEE